MLLLYKLLFFTSCLFVYFDGYYGLVLNITFETEDTEKILIQNKPTKIFFNCSQDFKETNNYDLSIGSSNPNIVEIRSNKTFPLLKKDYLLQSFFILEGLRIGYADITFQVNNFNTSTNVTIYPRYYKVGIVRTDALIDMVFTIILSILLAANLGIVGVTIDLEIIKTNVKKPIAPIIGFLTQFLFMPLSSYALAVTLFEDYYFKVGLFTIGCCPGGGASNLWTLLIGGDITLSVTLTFISIIAAFGMMPLWIFTLGNYLFNEKFKIPYINMLIVASGLVIPVGVGVIIQKCKPCWKNKAKKIIKWSTLLVLIVVSTLGVYINFYIFPFFTLNNILRSLPLPCAGFTVGAIAAIIFQRKLEEIIAISIETGLQNGALAYVLLKYSLPQPGADLSVAMTIIVMAVTSFVLLIIYILKILWKCFCTKKKVYSKKNKSAIELLAKG